MDGGYVLYSILSIVFCALLMHGLKTMNHKLIMPSLIYIPLSSIGIVIACSVYAAAISVEDSCGEPVYKIDKWGNRVVDHCPLTAAGFAKVAVAVGLLVSFSIWIPAWIMFYKAYKYILQPRNNQPTQQVPLQPQEGFASQPLQGVVSSKPYPEAPPPYSGVPTAGPAYSVNY